MVSRELVPRISKKFGDVGEWLRTRLGKDYAEKLLEMLWKDPRQAEFLYLDALLEDLNTRKNIEQPIVFLMDNYDSVDSENLRWRYKSKRISEAELWQVFLSSLVNCVGVTASRKPSTSSIENEIEEVELTELDENSCREFLEKRGILETELQSNILSVSGGNPFVLDAICDMAEMRDLTGEDVESLRADTLEEVRLRTWRKLFNKAEGLLKLIDKAALVPFFDRRIMDILEPDIRTDQWDRLLRLSFIKDRGDGTWFLHDLAKELSIVELGDRLHNLAKEVSMHLDKAANEQSDFALRGVALSVLVLFSEEEVITRLREITEYLFLKSQHTNALALLSAIHCKSDKGKGVVLRSRGRILCEMKRFSEAEQDLREAIELFRTMDADLFGKESEYLAESLQNLGDLLTLIANFTEAEEVLNETLAIYRNLHIDSPNEYKDKLAEVLLSYGRLMYFLNKTDVAENAFKESLDFFDEVKKTAPDICMSGTARVLRLYGSLRFSLGYWSEAEEIFARAHSLFIELKKKEPDSDYYKNEYALSLRSLSYLMLETSRSKEAEIAGKKALEIFRDLAMKEPEVFQREIARQLGFLIFLYLDTDRVEDANKLQEEEIYIYNDYAEREPLLRLNLANSKSSIARSCICTWNLSEAEIAVREMIDIYEEFRKFNEEISRINVKITRSFLAFILNLRCKSISALEILEENLDFVRELIEINPEIYQNNLGGSLWNNSVALIQIGNIVKAEEFAQEALKVWEDFSQKAPKSTYKPVPIMHNILASIFRQSRKYSASEEALRKAISSFREGIQKTPEYDRRCLAWTLNNLGVLLRTTKRIEESAKAYHEALDISRELSNKSPKVFPPTVALILNNLGIVLRLAGNPEDAESAYKEALEIRRKFSELAPEYMLPRVAMILNNLGVLLSNTNRHEKAIDTFYEALSIWREHAPRAPELFQHSLVVTLNNLGVILKQTNRHRESEKVYREAIELSESFADAESEDRISVIRAIFTNHALLLSTKESSDELAPIMDRLNNLGIKKLPSNEIWLEEEEEELIAYLR